MPCRQNYKCYRKRYARCADLSEWAQITLAAYLQAALLRKSGPSAAGASPRPTSNLKAVSTAPKPSGPFVCSADISPHSGESPLEGKVVSGANRMRWRRKESYPRAAPHQLPMATAFSLERLRRLLYSPGNMQLAHSCFGFTPRAGSLRGSAQTEKSRGTVVPRLP